jgi:hypothetical protein
MFIVLHAAQLPVTNSEVVTIQGHTTAAGTPGTGFGPPAQVLRYVNDVNSILLYCIVYNYWITIS